MLGLRQQSQGSWQGRLPPAPPHRFQRALLTHRAPPCTDLQLAHRRLRRARYDRRQGAAGRTRLGLVMTHSRSPDHAHLKGRLPSIADAIPSSRLWCGRGESNPHGLSPNGFSYHFGFRRPRRDRCGLWSGLSLHPSRQAVGAARLVSTPSRPGSPSGLGSGSPCHRFPRIWAVLRPAFPRAHSNAQVRCVCQFRHARKPKKPPAYDQFKPTAYAALETIRAAS